MGVREVGRGLGRRVQSALLRRDVAVLRYRAVNHLGPHLATVLDAMDVQVVIDVGANEGQTVAELRSLGFAGSIVSFEPDPEAFARLEEAHGGDPRWTGHRMALGEEAGTAELRAPRDDSLASLLAPNELGRTRFPDLAGPVRRSTVDVARLDEVWDDLVPRGRTFLKIDTQGFDLPVMRGAGDRLDDVLAVVTEIAINPIYDGVPAIADVFAAMAGWGFELSGLFPITRDRRGLRLIEANGVFLRSSAITT